jgi:hypothetical protein
MKDFITTLDNSHVFHAFATLTVLGMYFATYQSGHPSDVLEKILYIIMPYWFGAITTRIATNSVVNAIAQHENS